MRKLFKIFLATSICFMSFACTKHPKEPPEEFRIVCSGEYYAPQFKSSGYAIEKGYHNEYFRSYRAAVKRAWQFHRWYERENEATAMKLKLKWHECK